MKSSVKIKRHMKANDGSHLVLHVSSPAWTRKRNRLHQVNLQSAMKLARRALDRAGPSLIALGYVDVWRAHNKWIVEVTLHVAGSNQHQLQNVFPTATVEMISVKEGHRTILRAISAGARLKPLQSAKWKQVSVRTHANNEFSDWIEDHPSSSRIFRYGLDRHGNLLSKSWAPPNRLGHPRPRWLEDYAYGRHPAACQCTVCLHRCNN